MNGEHIITTKMKRTDAWRIAHALDQPGDGKAAQCEDKQQAAAHLGQKLNSRLGEIQRLLVEVARVADQAPAVSNEIYR